MPRRHQGSRGSRRSRSRSGSRSGSLSRSRRSASRSSRGSRAGRGERVKHTVKSRAPTKKEKERMREPLSKKSLAELQSIASSRGIPFGGMTRTQLLEKIQSYNVQERRE